MFRVNFCAILAATRQILTSGLRLKSNVPLPRKMEGCVTTTGGLKRTLVSPGKYQNPTKKTNFVGITPEKKLTNIQTPTDRPFRLSIEGNIGAGKSTLIEHFKSSSGVETYPEPLDHWRNLRGHNLLHLLYEDMLKWQNTFQTYVQFTRLKAQTTPPKAASTTVQIFERSVQNNRFCFLEMAHDNGMHSADYSVLDKWYRWIRENADIALDLIVYLRSTPEKVFERTVERGRPEETGITLDYLRKLHNYHERWLMTDDPRFNTIPVLVLDADKTLNDIHDQYDILRNKLIDKGRLSQSLTNDIGKVKRVLQLD